MILCIGEILADMVMNDSGEIRAHIGGAPFNVAVNASTCGAEVVFLGRVGDDPIGKFLKREARKFPLKCMIQTDEERNTTIAFVSIDESGERDFTFLRRDSADYHIEISDDLFDEVRPDIVHIGSLMLSDKVGRKIAFEALKESKKRKIKVSFDVNYREDVFKYDDKAVDACKKIIEEADIVKFSEEESELVYGKTFNEVFSSLENHVVCVTLGRDGSMIKLGDKLVTAESEPVEPVDTTGAGDAFFGAFLAGVDEVGFDNLNEENVKRIAYRANQKGAEATLHEGALAL